jgi:hypothetical protein
MISNQVYRNLQFGHASREDDVLLAFTSIERRHVLFWRLPHLLSKVGYKYEKLLSRY